MTARRRAGAEASMISPKLEKAIDKVIDEADKRGQSKRDWGPSSDVPHYRAALVAAIERELETAANEAADSMHRALVMGRQS